MWHNNMLAEEKQNSGDNTFPLSQLNSLNAKISII